MSSFDDLPFSFDNFSGRVRLFPLPNLVLFPHVMQPLHLFEPRYRQLLEDALAGDRLIAMALLAPGWEKDYEGRPPLGPVACLGRVTTYHRLDDGTYNVLLLGLKRIRVVAELPPTRLYREAEAVLCDDKYSTGGMAATAALGRKLREVLARVLPVMPEAHEQMDQLLGSDVPLGVLTDVVSYMLDIDLREKEALLAETNVERRAERLLAHLSHAAKEPVAGTCSAAGFPPLFSTN